jgi:hypothetical protein
MPLTYGYSDRTRSRNIATLRREGLPENQAVAAAYRIQREELRKHHLPMSRSLARRRHHRRGIARLNPIGKGPVTTALKWLGAGVLVGGLAGGIGSATGATTANLPTGIIGGAASVVGIEVLGGLVVGLASPTYRNPALATAGIGLAALLITQLVTTTMFAAPKTA